MTEYEVKLFGPYADAAGARAVRITHEGSDATDAAGLLGSIFQQQPRLRPLLTNARLAVNRRFAAPDQPVRAADEIALIGMLGGG